MKEFSFVLTFSLGKRDDPLDYLDDLFESGCDDATVSWGKGTGITLSFDRKAKDIDSAIKSAIDNVKRAIPHAKLIEKSTEEQ